MADGPTASAPRPPPLVLLVDDYSDTLVVMSMILEGAGFAVETAHDGVEALRKARMLRPRVIVTDIAMPGIDGVSLCRAIKRDDRTASIPVIGLSGYTRPGLTEEMAQAGFGAFLFKPCDSDDLIATIRAVLDGHH
jgi:CheY-like chemotaxis protein